MVPRLAIVLLFFFASPAFAQVAMRTDAIDFSVVLNGLDGTQAKDCTVVSADGKSCLQQEAMTLGHLAAEALATPDRGITAGQQVARAILAAKLYNGTVVELSAGEKKLICDQIAKTGLSTVIVGRAIALIDPNDIETIR